MRLFVYSAPRAGSHFVARSIAKTTGVGYAFSDVAPRGRRWIAVSHKKYETLRVPSIGVYRNPLDHALSFMDHPRVLSLDALVNAGFLQVRRDMLLCPADRRVSYDLLAVRAEPEMARLAGLIGWTGPMKMEPIADTRRATAGHVPMRYGEPGRWRKIIPIDLAMRICEALGEPLPGQEDGA